MSTNTYAVHVSYLVTGTVMVEAASEEDAEAQVEDGEFDINDVNIVDREDLQVEWSEQV